MAGNSIRGMPFSIGKDRRHEVQVISAPEASTLPPQLGQRKDVVNGSCGNDISLDRINKMETGFTRNHVNPVLHPVNSVQIPLRTIARNARHQHARDQTVSPQAHALSF